MTKEEAKIVKGKIKELQDIYNEFVEKLNELRGEQSVIINNIIKRIQDKKIQDILNKLKNK